LSQLDWKGIENQIYECPRCGYQMKGEELVVRDRIVCPRCGYHVIKKVKPPIVKRMKVT
jgi:DNA-directed RNA polymerase subunit RPC12/RpoP